MRKFATLNALGKMEPSHTCSADLPVGACTHELASLTEVHMEGQSKHPAPVDWGSAMEDTLSCTTETSEGELGPAR